MTLALVLVAAVALLAPGCGHKGAVLAPELVRPEPPTDFDAASTPDGVRLTWTRPTRYAGGARMRDLGSFRIERADADVSPLEFSFAGELEMKDQARYQQQRRLEFFDGDVLPEHQYIYRIRARTLDGYESPWAGPARVRVRPGSAAPDTPQ